jgi:predicted CoA-binding protein
MASLPRPVADFLAGKRIIVAGVSRSGSAPANAIFRRLRESGHEVIPVNPNASQIEGQQCYPDVLAFARAARFARPARC